MEEVILVDEKDMAIGTMEKMEAHKRGLLHRAFSVVLFNTRGEMLLQKRSRAKYHSGGLWTNTCCSHPRPDELMQASVRQRLLYEMGIDLETSFAFKFIYRAHLDNDLTEHEVDHVYVGTFDDQPVVNPGEVEDWKFVSVEYLRQDLMTSPQHYTPWFKLILENPFLKGGVGNIV